MERESDGRLKISAPWAAIMVTVIALLAGGALHLENKVSRIEEHMALRDVQIQSMDQKLDLLLKR